MDRKDKQITQILSHIADAASNAADGVTDVVQSAGQAVGIKYDEVKLTLELNRLFEEQKRLYTDIGHTMFLIKSCSINNVHPNIRANDAQLTIDRLLLLADQKQQEIDLISMKLNNMNGSKVCIICGKVCSPRDIYCKACGAKLNIDGE